MDGLNSDVEYLSSWDLSGGEFYDRNEVDIPEKGASLTRNVVHLYGKIRPRPGCQRILSPSPEANPVTHIGQYTPLISPVSDIVATFQDGTDITVYRDTGTLTDISGGAMVGVGAVGVKPMSVNFAGSMYYIPGDSDLMVYGPANPTLTSVASLQPISALQPPLAPRILAVAPDRLFAADVLDPDTGERVSYRLHWCDHLAPATWGYGVGAGTANYVDLAEDNDPITGLYTYSDTITVFKPRLMYTGKFVGGQNIYDFRILADGPGCASHNTICRYRDGKFVFLGDDNVYIARPGEMPQAIGSTIKNRFRENAELPDMSRAEAFCDIDNDLYWLYLPKAGTSEVRLVFVCNLITGAWHTGEMSLSGQVTATHAFREGVWDTKLVIGDEDGFIHEFTYDATSDNGDSFSAFWESGLISVERISQGKALDMSVVEARCFSATDGGRVSISISTSDGLDETDVESFGEQRFGVDEDHYLTGRAGDLSGEFFKFRFAYPNIAQAAHVQGIQVGMIFGGGPSKS